MSTKDLDMKLEVVVIPVSDVDRATGDNFRLVQSRLPVPAARSNLV
jgi:hypothetical protein